MAKSELLSNAPLVESITDTWRFLVSSGADSPQKNITMSDFLTSLGDLETEAATAAANQANAAAQTANSAAETANSAANSANAAAASASAIADSKADVTSLPAQTFAATALTNPYTAGLAPRRLGDVAVNTTSLEIWIATAEISAAGSWQINGLIAIVERLPLTQAIAQLKEDLAGLRNLVQANIHDLNNIPAVMGVPLTLFAAGVPSSTLIPDNWPSSLPWDGIPFFKGQQYINTSATSGGLYYAKGNEGVSDWINA